MKRPTRTVGWTMVFALIALLISACDSLITDLTDKGNLVVNYSPAHAEVEVARVDGTAASIEEVPVTSAQDNVDVHVEYLMDPGLYTVTTRAAGYREQVDQVEILAGNSRFLDVALEPLDGTDPSDPADPSDPTDPSGPSDPTDPTDPTEPSDPTDPTDPEPAPTWTSRDVGSPAKPGSFDPGTWTVRGGGADISGRSDQFHFAYTEIEGDFDIAVRLSSQEGVNGWAKAGLMARAGTGAGDGYASILVTPGHGIISQTRPRSDVNTRSFYASGQAPVWLRLVRDGATVTTYTSADGSSWAQRHRESLSDLPATLLVGLAVTSHDGSRVGAADFDPPVLDGATPVASSSPSALAIDVQPDSATVEVSGPDGFRETVGGDVVLDDLAAGAYRVDASGEGYVARSAQVAVAEGETAEVTLALDPVPAPAPAPAPAPSTPGVLRIHPDNSAYFTLDGDEALYLTGSHTWNAMRDIGPSYPAPAMDYDGFLDMMQANGHNFLRFWVWDMVQGVDTNIFGSGENWVSPMPWKRTGPGTAADGQARFDLEQLDPAYFERLRARVVEANRRGIAVGIMLFEGYGPNVHDDGSHPFQGGNNVNGVDVGAARSFYSSPSSRVLELQRAYVRAVVDAVNDLDLVMFEIANEAHNSSRAWQEDMVRYIRSYEAGLPKQHLIGMTFMPGDSYSSENTRNDFLYASPADWVSPRNKSGEDWRSNPPEAGSVTDKIVINDTDHIWGVGGDRIWVWKTFTRGHHAIFMDPWTAPQPGFRMGASALADIRTAMGQTAAYAERMDLAATRPEGSLSSTGYALANDREILAYHPNGGSITVDLRGRSGTWDAEWFSPDADRVTGTASATGGQRVTLAPPHSGDAVLYLRAR